MESSGRRGHCGITAWAWDDVRFPAVAPAGAHIVCSYLVSFQNRGRNYSVLADYMLQVCMYVLCLTLRHLPASIALHYERGGLRP